MGENNTLANPCARLRNGGAPNQGLPVGAGHGFCSDVRGHRASGAGSTAGIRACPPAPHRRAKRPCAQPRGSAYVTAAGETPAPRPGGRRRGRGSGYARAGGGGCACTGGGAAEVGNPRSAKRPSGNRDYLDTALRIDQQGAHERERVFSGRPAIEGRGHYGYRQHQHRPKRHEQHLDTFLGRHVNYRLPIDDTPIQTRQLGFNSDDALPNLFDLDRVEVLAGPTSSAPAPRVVPYATS